MYKRLPKEFNRILKLAMEYQECQRAAVGCTIGYFDEHGLWQSIIAGTNGPTTNVKCTNEVGNCGCIHAESVTISNYFNYRKSYTVLTPWLVMLCTYAPCLNCANLIIASKVVNCFIYDIPYRDTKGVALLEAGLSVYKLSDIGPNDLDRFRQKI